MTRHIGGVTFINPTISAGELLQRSNRERLDDFQIDSTWVPSLNCLMRIIDLTDSYHNLYVRHGNREEYEASFPDLFEHYYSFWTKREYDLELITEDEIRIRKGWITLLIEKLTPVLKARNIDHGLVNYVFFVGVGTTNGHAFRHDGEYYVWLPLETYTTDKRVQIFVTHEIAHALHYLNCPAFYCNDKNEQLRMSRQLITEGLATWLTRELLSVSNLDALWADYVSESEGQEWWQKCCDKEQELCGRIAAAYHTNDHDLEIFFASDPTDIYKYRSGYFAGLRLIDRYASENNLSVLQLLSMPRDRIEQDIFNLI